MTTKSSRTPRPRQRLAGLLYLLATLAGYASHALMAHLFVPDSASATAGNVTAHVPLYASAFTLNLVGVAAMLGALVLVDEIVRPLNAGLARVAVYCGLVACGLHALLNVFLYGARMALRAPYNEAFYTRQVESLGHLLLSMFGGGYLVAIVFSALYALCIWQIMAMSAWSHVRVILLAPMILLAWVVASLPRVLGDEYRFAIGVVLYGQVLLGLGLMAPDVVEVDQLVSWLMDRLEGGRS